MSILLDKCPTGGRPLKDLVFQVDKDDSKLAWKIGYIQCGCGQWHGVSIGNEQIKRFMKSIHYTNKENQLEPDSPKIPLRQKVGEWLAGPKPEPEPMSRQTPGWVYANQAV